MSGEDHARFLDLLPPFVLGTLQGEDLRSLERHLNRGCEECERLEDEWRRTVEELAESVEPIPPSPLTRRRVLASVEGTPGVDRRTRWPLWGVMAASFVALASSAGLFMHQLGLESRLEAVVAERDVLVREVGALRAEVDGVRRQSARLSSVVQAISSPSTQTVVLASLVGESPASGAAFIRPTSRRALFYAYDLPSLAADETYQLWLIAGGVPVSAGIFAVDSQGYGTLEVPGVVPEDATWAVTIEPAGGVPQPTGTMVLSG